MAMADDLVVMNQGDVLQSGPPREIYHFPATVFVGNFIGGPPMNFLPVDDAVAAGDERVHLHGAPVPSHARRRGGRARAARHPVLSTAVDRRAGSLPLRGRVIADEYLGSHQVFTDRDGGGRRARASKRRAALRRARRSGCRSGRTDPLLG